MNTRPRNREARPTFPQVGVQDALTSVFQVYSAEPGTHTIDELKFKVLLGYDLSASALARLLGSLKTYDLIDRRRNGYVLTDRAVQLFTTEDYVEFRARLYDVAVFPELMRELAQSYGDQLDSKKLDADLKSRQITGKDKTTLVAVLRENERLLGHDQSSRDLFETFSAFRLRAVRPSLGAGVAAARSWLKSQQGRTVMLSTVAVLFAGTLIYFATNRPGNQTAADGSPTQGAVSRNQTPRQVTAPVPEVSLPITTGPLVTGNSGTTATVSPTAADLAAIGLAATRASAQAATRRAPTAPIPAVDGSAVRGPTAAVPTAAVPATAASTTTATGRSQDRPPAFPNTGSAASRPTVAGSSEGRTAVTDPTPPGTGTALPRPAAASSPPTTASSTPVPGNNTSGIRASNTPNPGTPSPGTQASATASPTQPASPATVQTGSDQPRYSDTLTRGRELARLFYSQRLTPLWSAFSPAVKAEWESFSAFQAYRAGGLKTFGTEKTILVENVRQDRGVTYYTRTALFELGPEKPWTLIIGLDAQGRVVEFNVVAAEVLPKATANSNQ